MQMNSQAMALKSTRVTPQKPILKQLRDWASQEYTGTLLDQSLSSLKKSDCFQKKKKVQTNTKKIGDTNEDLAVLYLESKGYEIEDRNISYPFGEVDIIAKAPQNPILVFLEVRSRKNLNYGTPEESVNSLKQRQIVRASQAYLKNKYKNKKLPICRFDVIGILGRGEHTQINHIERAFVLEPNRRSPWQAF